MRRSGIAGRPRVQVQSLSLAARVRPSSVRPPRPPSLPPVSLRAAKNSLSNLDGLQEKVKICKKRRRLRELTRGGQREPEREADFTQPSHRHLLAGLYIHTTELGHLLRRSVLGCRGRSVRDSEGGWQCVAVADA